ncbi:MAG: hypothetical protein N2C12_16270 [Planctomycetales bacterium]
MRPNFFDFRYGTISNAPWRYSRSVKRSGTTICFCLFLLAVASTVQANDLLDRLAERTRVPLADVCADFHQANRCHISTCKGRFACECENGSLDLGCCEQDPLWTVTAEALILRQSNRSQNQTLLVNFGGNPVLNSQDFDFGSAVGPRLSLTRHDVMGRDCDLELGFFGMDSWADSAFFDAAGGPYFLTADAFGGPPVTDALAALDSSFYNFEVNLRRQCRPWLNVLVGFRAIEYQQDYLVSGTDIAGGGTYLYSVGANNHLFGFQMGADLLVWRSNCGLELEATTKGAIFASDGDVQGRFTDLIFGDLIDALDGNRLAGLVEIGLAAKYPVNDWLSIQAGYQVMWMDGVALALNQIPQLGLIAPFVGVRSITATQCSTEPSWA